MTSYRPPILASLDGSIAAEAVLPFVSTFAQAYDTHIFLVGVVERRTAVPYHHCESPDQAYEQARARVLNNGLARAAGRLRSEGRGVSGVLTYGDPATAIIDLGERLQATMIAIASRGEDGASRALLGSVADKVVRAGVRPTLVVPTADTPSRLPRPIRRIVVPLDGSELAEAALGPAQQIARACHASLRLVRVVDYVVALTESTLYLPDLAPLDGSILAEAHRYLHAQCEAIAHDIPREAIVLRGPAFVALDEYLRTAGADLVIMTTHGRGGVRRLVLGSVADRMLRSHQPVLLIRNQYQVFPHEEAGELATAVQAPAASLRDERTIHA
jgi:nucleotide-binding universal stress UspA family protein